MKTTLINLAKAVISATGIGEKVPRMRYFPNPYTDISKSEENSFQIPENALKIQTNTLLDEIVSNFGATQKNGENGLYLGTAGVAYMFYHLSKVQSLNQDRNKFLEHAVRYLTPALIVAEKNARHKTEEPSFLLGNCGIYAVAAAVFNAAGNAEQSAQYRDLYNNAASVCKQIDFLDYGSDELFVGRAGYIFAGLWLANETNTPVQNPDLYEICQVMVNSGREYARRRHSPCPLMYSYYDTEYLGAAHGLCTIFQALLTVPGYLNSNPKDAVDVRTSVDFLLSIQDSDGNFPCDLDEIGQPNELVHWCHGAGGMIYLMARAYLVWKDDKYLQSCEKMADLIWRKGLLKKGPGICHGVAGNGYVFLLMYRMTGKTIHLSRAVAFAKFMEKEEFRKGARVPDYPYSLYEGVAGTACFIADVTNPTKAAFPFSDVFLKF